MTASSGGRGAPFEGLRNREASLEVTPKQIQGAA